MSFLASHGVAGRPLTPNSDMIGATVPVTLAETMLAAKYEELSHESAYHPVHRSTSGTDVYQDITTGSNSGCGFRAKGWPATQGWDAVTGLGTFNYKNMVKKVLELQ